jgi:hypothetical protein
MLDPLCRMSSDFRQSREKFRGPNFNRETARNCVDTQSVTCYFQWS